MERTKTGRIAICIIGLIFFSLFAQSCHLGKKDCGCGMDLNGTYKRKHKWF